MLAAHGDFFAALRGFMEKGHRVVLIPGNHDVDIFWPHVRDRLLEELGGPDSDHFHFESSGIYRTGSLYVEHGNQYYADSVFENFTHPFLRDTKTGELRLERSWGGCFMEYFSNGMMSERNPFINNVRPIPNMVFLGIQDESWWFKTAYGFKLLRFMSRVGFPPFKESRELLRRKREGRLDSWGYSRKRFMELFSGRGRVELQGVDDAEGLPIDFPEEDELEESGRDELLLDSLATREDALSVAGARSSSPRKASTRWSSVTTTVIIPTSCSLCSAAEKASTTSTPALGSPCSSSPAPSANCAGGTWRTRASTHSS